MLHFLLRLHKYKLHYIYREFTIDFFKMDLTSLPKNASSLKLRQHDSYTMALCLTYRVNLGLSLRKTAQALKDIHGIDISHQQVANYCTTATICVKPFTDSYDYKVGKVITADELSLIFIISEAKSILTNFEPIQIY